MSSRSETLNHAAASPRATTGSWLRLLLEMVFVWITLARSRRDLAALDQRALQDIGIDPATAHEEASKPFWRSV